MPTARPAIRGARRDDAAAIAAIYAPMVTDSAISFEEDPPSAATIEERIAESHAWLVAELDGAVVGYAYAARFHPRAAYRWCTEISVYLTSDARRRGIGRQLVGALLDELRNLGFVHAFAGTTLPNPGSTRLFESFGFRQIARWEQVGFKLGAWHDVGWWQLELQRPTVPPPSLPAT